MRGIDINVFSKKELVEIKNIYYNLREDGWSSRKEDVKKEFVVARQVRYRRSKSDFVTQSFMYYGYDTKEEMIHYIDSSNNNLFEYCADDIRNLYMDLDNRKQDNPATLEEVEFMIAKLMNDLNDELGESITRNQVIVLVNGDYVSKMICSIHIVIPTITMRSLEMKSLITNLNETREFVDKLDESVYNKTQLFRFYRQSKLNMEDGSNKYVAIGLETTYATDQTFITSYHEHNEKRYRLPEPELIKFNKKIKELGPDREVKLSEVTILNVAGWMDKLNTDFYTSHAWIQVLYLIMKLATQDTEIDKDALTSLYESRSRDIANNNIYSKTENDKQIAGFVITNVKGGAKKLVKLLNLYCDDYYFTFCAIFVKDKELLKEWILETGRDINISTMTEVGRNITQHKLSLDNTRYRIDLKNGFVLDKESKTLHNFKISRHPVTTKIYDEISVERLVDGDANVDENWRNILIDYLEDDDTRDLFNRADWACGKSRGIMVPLIEWIIKHDPDMTICVPSTHTSLNNKLQDDLGPLGFVSHLNADRDELRNSKYVIISTQSICQLDGKCYDVCIFDEICNLTSQFNGSNFITKLGTSYQCFKTMNHIRKMSEKNIYMDADLNHNLVKMITSHTKSDKQQFKQPIIYDVKDNKFLDYKYKLCREEATLTTRILEAIDNNKKIFIASATKSYLDNLLVTIKKKYPNYNTTYISKAGVASHNMADDTLLRDNDKDNYIKNLNDNLIRDDVSCLCISPTIVVGTSINDELFDIGFLFCCPLTLTAEESCQQIMRVRVLKEKLVYACLPVKSKCWSNFNHLSLEQVEFNIKNKVAHYTDTKLQDEYTEYTLHPHFRENLVYNEWRKRNSENSFANEFIGVLNRHNLNWEFMIEAKDIVVMKEVKDDKVELQTQLQKEFDETEILDCFELAKLKKKMNNRTDITTDVEYLQFTKSNLLFNLKNIIIDETSINTIIDLVEHKKVSFECHNGTTRGGVVEMYKPITHLIENLNYLPTGDNINCLVFKYNDKWCGKDPARERLLFDVRGEDKIIHHLDGEYMDSFNSPIGITDLRGCCKTIKQIQCMRRAKTTWNKSQLNIQYNNKTLIKQDIQGISQVNNKQDIHLMIVKILNFQYQTMILTNKQFEIIVSQHPDDILAILKLVAQDIKYNEADVNEAKEMLLSYRTLNSFKMKKITKIVYHAFKDQLHHYDIKMEYGGKSKTHNSTRQTDTIIIKPYNMIAVYDKLIAKQPIVEYDDNDLLNNKTYKIISDKFGNIPNNKMAFRLHIYDSSIRPTPKRTRPQHKLIINELDLELKNIGLFLLRREHHINSTAICGYSLKSCFNTLKSHKRIRFADWVSKNEFYSKQIKKVYDIIEIFKHTNMIITEADVTSKSWGKYKYNKTNIPLYKSGAISKWVKTDTDGIYGIYTKTSQFHNYRTYEVPTPPPIYTLEMNGHEQKLNIKALLRKCIKFSKPQVIIKQDTPNTEFIKTIKYENMVPNPIEIE